MKILNNNYENQPLLTNTNKRPNDPPCKQQPGTILRIFIPAGAVINLLNLIEVSSPSGICLIVRIPLLGGNTLNAHGLSLENVTSVIQSLGGTVEVMGS